MKTNCLWPLHCPFAMHKLCKTFCINWQDGSRRYVRVEGAGSKWFPPPSCHPPLSANSLAKWVSNGGFNSNSSINMNDKRKFITMESIWYIFTFFSQFQSPLTALSSELPQDCQNRPNDQNGDPKQLCLMKNAFYSIILAIQGDDIAVSKYFIYLDRKNHGKKCIFHQTWLL